MNHHDNIKEKPGFSRKMFWTPEIPFKTGFTVLIRMDLLKEIPFGAGTFRRKILFPAPT
jgi:hypothetical protein